MRIKTLFLFKTIIVFSFLFMCVPDIVKAQNVEAGIATLADDAMSSWSSSWWADKYILGSTNITSYRETSDNGIQANGTFKFSRYGKRFTANFTVKVMVGGSRPYVSSICYTDPSTNQSDCYTP